jgi:methionyl-tRNA synthetase
MDKYFLTTPIYYINDHPHIGHAYTTIAADVVGRYKRMRGLDVLFCTGTDEHAQKVVQSAQKKGMETKDFVDELARLWRETWDLLEIDFDDFIRTSEPRHERVVAAFVDKLYQQGDIYKGYYEGWYCFWDEAFFVEADVKERTCPDCGRELQYVKEENYFFRLSNYNQALLDHFLANPHFVEPDIRYNEMLNLVKAGLRDISISRSTLTWGVPLPFDPKHVVYVWVDALLNYITVAGWPDNPERFERYWPADLHIVGKEINRFHSIIWPAMLMAAGLPMPRKVFAHGFWTKEGKKISKSVGNIIDPIKLVDRLSEQTGDRKVAVDVFRYFILREVPFGADGDFTDASLTLRFSADLANDLGNLLNRSIPLVEKYCQGLVPAGKVDSTLAATAEAVVIEVEAALDRLAFSDALTAIWSFLGNLNKYIDETAPWRLGKEGQAEALGDALYNTLEGLRFTALLVAPFLPRTAQVFWESLGLPGQVKDGRWDRDLIWGQLSSGLQVQKTPPLFPRPEKEKGK